MIPYLFLSALAAAAMLRLHRRLSALEEVVDLLQDEVSRLEDELDDRTGG